MQSLNPIRKRERTDTWYTPREIVHSLGQFDLDPCTSNDRPWNTAKTHLTEVENGLHTDWIGRVWLNPPYSNIYPWLKKLSTHNNGTALVFTRTDVKAFHEFVFNTATSKFFFSGRIKFYDQFGRKAKDNSPAPSILIAYNEFNSEAIEQSGLKGSHIPLTNFHLVLIEVTGKTWRVIVDEAMEIVECGNLNEIYNTVVKIAPGKVANNKHFKEKIRQTLQKYFNSVDRGVWETYNKKPASAGISKQLKLY